MKQVNRMIPTTKLDHRQSNTLTLKEGQVVTGRVMKFFPGNKAVINLSGHQVVAQLDASLQANQNYLLQVKGISPAVQLQVVHQQSVASYDEAAQTLLNLSGVKASKAEHALLANMLKQQLPLQTNNIDSLIQLAKANHVPNQQQILSEMVQRQLPLNQEVFNSIHQRINQPLAFTQIVDQLQTQIQQSGQSQELCQLSNRLDLLSSKSISNQKLLESFVFQTLKEVGQGSHTTFQMLQKAGLVSNQMTYQEWSNTWSNWAKQNKIQLSAGSQQSSLPPLPFNYSANQIAESISQLSQQQFINDPKQLQLMKSIAQQLVQVQNSSVNSYQQNLLSRGLDSTLWNQMSAKLPDHIQPVMQQLQSFVSNQNWNQVQQLLQSSDGQQLLNQINQLINSQVSSTEQRGLSFWQSMVSLNSPQNVDFNLSHIKSFLQMTQAEASPNQDYPSLSSLIRSVQGQTNQTAFNESLQQMNQIINSIHLSNTDISQRDLTSFTIQFPKDMFNLNQDLFMEFEGKKQEDGTIHPKQCRVIFYLDLPNLNETIMDMHVQNGHVDLSVYHDQPEHLRLLTKPLIASLNDKLQKQDYSSVQVQFKSIHEEHNKEKSIKYTSNEWQQGVDFRI
ncbi:hypothetical protein E3U55_05260 [Filobacillus milosensis]|uniref:Flagellar hook-length control protein FliK n=1 Tax=Filobacillus milosensis TaxID=94137 RepID=A0A4Y8IP34_9BACI|nr:hypothetical protein [Filobacillus milosensis]TFB23227.1 hypothetical protein E3U55_05260 [Filobacillus milosensis]